jgi:hypothetical protein
VKRVRSKAVRIASSHVITTCATIAAILLFVMIGSKIVPAAIIGGRAIESLGTLQVAFLLNIAIPPGITTSVSSRSNCVPLRTTSIAATPLSASIVR